MSAPTKICSCPTCVSDGEPLPFSAFGKNSSSPDGKHWYCRNCHNLKQRKWKTENPRKVKKWKREYDKGQRAARQLELDL